MNTTDGPVGVRRFEAQPPFWGSKVASVTTPAWQKNPGKSYAVMVVGVLAFSAVLGCLWVGVQSLAAGDSEFVQSAVGHGFKLVLLLLLFGGVYGWSWWSRRKKIVISVTDDGLTVNTRPGDTYSFHDAKLGTWGVTGGRTMGTALHLHCGPRRFILGGRDRRVAAGTRLDAPDAGYGLPIDVDASVSAEAFDEILTMAARRSGLDVRPPAPDEPTRCLLFVNPLLIQEMGPFAIRKKQDFTRSLQQPKLAIDVGPQTIRVIDPTTNAVIASVSAAHVTAAPVVFRPMQRGHLIPNLGQVLTDAAANYWSTTPGMRVTVPGMAPLTIGCRDSVMGLDLRFAWPDGVPTEPARADYEVSGTDWRTLVDVFGLSAHLQTRGQ